MGEDTNQDSLKGFGKILKTSHQGKKLGIWSPVFILWLSVTFKTRGDKWLEETNHPLESVIKTWITEGKVVTN